MSQERKGRKESVHATISDESYDILMEYEEEYGSKSAVVDVAIKTLKKYREPNLEDRQKIWCRARKELNMVLVGKTTFLSYIKGKVEDAYTNNIAIEVIEWYLGKRVEETNLEEFLMGLKGMWLVANYFYKIELEQNKYGTYQMRFNHDLNEEFSKFWSGYFEKLITSYWNCFVESFIRTESFYLIIKEKK